MFGLTLFEKNGVATLLIQYVNLSTAELIEPIDDVSILSVTWYKVGKCAIKAERN